MTSAPTGHGHAADGGASAPGAGGAPESAGATGRAGGDPAAGAGNVGRPRYEDPADSGDEALASVPRAPKARSMPVASDAPPGAAVGPGGPLAGDLPQPPAMQYPAGAPIGPLPGQHRPPDTVEGTGMPGGAPTVALAAPATATGPATGEWVTCPECGESALIDPAQRRSEDFCAHCDFPLFWARSAVVPLSTDETGASLRRLPGTVGRAATASVACPHCGEPNSPTAIICIRCSGAMVIPEPEPEPEPEPVYVPPPPEPEPEPGFPLWWVVGASVVLIIITILVAWIALAI